MVIQYTSDMLPIAKLTIKRHDIDQFVERPGMARATTRDISVVNVYRVVGGNSDKARRLCEQRTVETTFPPAVALTLEGLEELAESHVLVCRTIRQTCLLLHREFHLCGVTRQNRKALERSGLLDSVDAQNVHASVAMLLHSLASPQSQRPGGRKAGAKSEDSHPDKDISRFWYPFRSLTT